LTPLGVHTAVLVRLKILQEILLVKEEWVIEP
jgi:hypothetical protein